LHQFLGTGLEAQISVHVTIAVEPFTQVLGHGSPLISTGKLPVHIAFYRGSPVGYHIIHV
jgi:hypothetical protein